MRRAMLQSIGGQTPLVCDLVSGFIHGYSHRKLRNAYTGDAIEVRESAGNTFDDIGFIGEDLNESALTAFVGANNGFESKMYDQIGSRVIENTTNAEQPEIVSSGTIVKSSGKPYAQYNGSSTGLTTQIATTPITDKNCTVFVVFESQSSLSNALVFQERRIAGVFVNINSDTRTTNFLCGNYAPDSTTRQLFFSSQQPTSTKRVFILKRVGTDTEIYDESNTLIDTVNNGSAVFNGNTTFGIGRSFVGTAYFGGKIAELLINDTALSSGDQTTVLNNIKAYYGI